MIIGIPREIKDNEYRVSMTPGGVHQLNERGHTVLVETGAGGGQLFLRRGLRRRPVSTNICGPTWFSSPTFTWPRRRH